MQYFPDGTEIVLWGLGNAGKLVLAGEFGNYKISFAVDRKWAQRQIEIDELGSPGNITVYSPDVLDEISLDNKVLVISTYRWQEVAESLEEKGKHIFRDYIPFCYLKSGASLDAGFLRFCKDDSERKALLKKLSYGKKLCAVYGSCHVHLYESWLLKSKQFTEQYCMLRLPYVNSAEQHIAEPLKMSCIYSVLDLLLLSFVYPIYGSPDWRTIKSWADAGKKCKVILITNAAFEGYFPQVVLGIPELRRRCAWGDKNINKLMREGKSADEIYSILSSPSFYDAEWVNRYYETALDNLEKSESVCDIQIADYIRKYGRQKRLMRDRVHPYPCVMRELTIRIFRKIGLDIDMLTAISDEVFAPNYIGGMSNFIYPSVFRALGIAEGEENKKEYMGFDYSSPVDFPEYVDLYVKLNKPYLCDKS